MWFHLLGTLRLECSTEPCEAPELPKLRKVRGLFAYLLFFHDHPHPREELATLFWGDVPDERARDSLSTALRLLRAWLPQTGAILHADRFTVEIALGVASLDVAELESGLNVQSSRAARAAALNLYQAELLAGWPEDWVLLERARLQARVLDAGTTLLREYLEDQEWQSASGLAEQLLEHDPLDATLQELLIRALLGMGQRDAARRRLQQYSSLLTLQMGSAAEVDPALLNAILNAPAPVLQDRSRTSAAPPKPAKTAPNPLAQFPFLPRQEEQAALEASLLRLRQGGGGLLLFRGPAGSGKTRLITETLNEARGLLALEGRSYELDRDVPFSMLLKPLTIWLLEELVPAQVLARIGAATVSVLTQLIPGLAAGLPGLSPLPALPPAEMRSQLVQALLGALLVAGKAPGAPLALFLDDLQFADTASLLVLSQLMAHLPTTPLLIIAAYPPEEIIVGSPLSLLLNSLQQQGAEVIDIGGFTLAEAQSLVEPRQPQAGLSAWLYEQSGGNALFLLELLRGLSNAGAIAADTTLGGWYQLAPNLPPLNALITDSLQATVIHRFQRLSANAQLICQIAAVAEAPLDFATLNNLSFLIDQETLLAIEESAQCGFLQQVGVENCYQPTLPLLRAIIYRSLSPTRRLYFQGRLALRNSGG